MRRLLLILLVTVPLAGCQFFNRGQDVAVIDLVESVESGEALDDVPAIPGIEGIVGDDAASTAPEDFNDPTIESQPSATVSANLIRSTDPTARTRQVERSRTDPFASLPIPPEPEPVISPVPVTGNGSGASAATNGGNGSGSGSGGGSGAVANLPEPTPPPVRVQPDNEPLVEPSPIAALPPIPQPVVAPTVSVSGVIQLGDEPYAILRSGSEPERYVRVGDHIAGGSVRVKRIETLAFEPRVILEENGIEVSRPISSGRGGSDGASVPVAASGTVPVVAAPAVSPVLAPVTLPVPAVTVPNTQAARLNLQLIELGA